MSADKRLREALRNFGAFPVSVVYDLRMRGKLKERLKARDREIEVLIEQIKMIMGGK